MTSRRSGTGIEYLTKVWNFYSGCRHKQMGICPVPNCWAKGITGRFPDKYPEGFDPDIHYEALKPFKLKKPEQVGVCFMGDLGGIWVHPLDLDNSGRLLAVSGQETLRDAVFQVLEINSNSQFFFLTKTPKNYARWLDKSHEQWPENAWLGATVCNEDMWVETRIKFAEMSHKNKWLSIEPLLSPLQCRGKILNFLELAGVNWVVIGGQSQPKVIPKMEWVLEITNACDAAKIPVWIKNNMGLGIPRQELPAGCSLRSTRHKNEVPAV